MVKAIIKEVILRKHEIEEPIQTIYFGGGTPSLLSENQINYIFDELNQNFDLSQVKEVTLEANPDDLNSSKLKALGNSPINRLSIGVQSFFDEDLRLMNRAHQAKEAEICIKNAQDFGFDNITIDLIYGSNTTTNEMWQMNLEKAIDLKIPHISSYALTVEPKTKLDADIENGRVKPLNEQHQETQFEMLQTYLASKNFIHYEISNFALDGFFAVHNSNYWKSKKYFGFGPSAHSFDGFIRKWNVSNNSLYLKNIANNILPNEIEVLSEKDRYNEMIMIGLRTSWGLDIDDLMSEFSNDIVDEFSIELESLMQENLIIKEDNRILIPANKKFYSDGIASRLFYV